MGGHIIGRTGEFCDSEGGKEGRLSGTGVYPENSGIRKAEGRPVGFALYFENFSTFLGRTGLHLEDLFVDPDQRGKGYGKQLFQAVARIAAERGCQRLEWACLNWNQPSIDFYHYMGAVPLEEWTTFRLAGGAIEAALEK